MGDFLCLLFSLSVSGGLLVLFVAALNRLLRGRIPSSFLCCLWLLALARFLLPVGSAWSVTNRVLGAFREARTQAAPPAGTPALLNPAWEEGPSAEPAGAHAPSVPSPDEAPALNGAAAPAAAVLIAAWGAGALACLGWRLYSYHRLNRELTEGERPVADWELELYSELAGERSACPVLRRSAALQSPVLAGVLRPAVWLPAGGLDAAGLSYALRHELAHWRRRDLHRKWAAALAACLHWFNPAAWYLLRAVGRDCELSCDEAVVTGLPARDRRAYGELLLRCAAGKAPAGAICTSLKTQKQVMRERLAVIMRIAPDGKKSRALFAAAAAAVILMGVTLGAYAAWGETGAGGDAAPEMDLNRNGVPETVNVVWLEDEMCYQLTVTEGNAVIFTENAYVSHAGWNALFLYQKDGQDCLLRYTPEMWQGDASYGYRLFYLAEDGSEVAVQENRVDFDVNFGMSIHGVFDPAAIDAFLAEVNSLLSGSIQLMNTDSDLLEAFEREGSLRHVPSFLCWEEDFSYDGRKTVLENLIEYKSAMEDIFS